jgi:hypothetical protein
MADGMSHFVASIGPCVLTHGEAFDEIISHVQVILSFFNGAAHVSARMEQAH